LNAVELIVNADDLGATPAVNDAVFKLVDEALVTSATFIANAPYVEEACRRAAGYTGCSFGVHLNVTEYTPLTDPWNLRGLLDDNGNFAREKIRTVPIDSALSEGIFQEFSAQIERLSSLGATVGHIDSHEHVHTIPGVFPILKKIQKRFNIRKVRISRNIYGLDESPPLALKLKKAVYNTALRHYYHTTTPQGFGDFKSFHANAQSKKLNRKRVEVMVHPGSELYGDGEIELLKSPWRESLDFQVRLISWADLG